MAIRNVPSVGRVRSENEIVLCQFCQCCHHRFVFDRCVIHKNATVKHWAKIRIEHGVVCFVHTVIIHIKNPLTGVACVSLSIGIGWGQPCKSLPSLLPECGQPFQWISFQR